MYKLIEMIYDYTCITDPTKVKEPLTVVAWTCDPSTC